MTENDLTNALHTYWAYHLLGLGLPWPNLVETSDRALAAGLYSELFREILYDGTVPPTNWIHKLSEELRSRGIEPLPWPLTPETEIMAIKLYVRDQLQRRFQQASVKTLSDAKDFVMAIEHYCGADLDQLDLSDFKQHYYQWHYHYEDILFGAKYTQAKSHTIHELIKSAQRWLSENQVQTYP